MQTKKKLESIILNIKDYVTELSKWFFLSVFVGVLCGFAGILFHVSVDEATHLREKFPFILFFLPVAGVIIVFLYKICRMDNDKGTNSVFIAVRENEKLSPFLAPLILIATTLTHFCGGSAGREGAALQIGGGVASYVARLFRLNDKNTSVLIMCGMSALFSAVFGTPLTAVIFTLEVIMVGVIHYRVFLPALIASLSAFGTAMFFGVEKTSFSIMSVPPLKPQTFLFVAFAAILTALLSILFIYLMHNCTHLFSKYIKNKYLRVLTGAIIVIILTLLVGNFDYNGAGMNIIRNAVETGSASPFAFILKIIFTVVTLSVGFKGGEIVPSFFIGSTFGVLIAPLCGLDPSFSAAICLIAFFCSVVNSPLASLVLSIELFGGEGLLYFAVAVAVSYIISGNHSLYSAQKIVYSKLHSSFVDEREKSEE